MRLKAMKYLRSHPRACADERALPVEPQGRDLSPPRVRGRKALRELVIFSLKSPPRVRGRKCKSLRPECH
jgi:hypothetical protein